MKSKVFRYIYLILSLFICLLLFWVDIDYSGYGSVIDIKDSVGYEIVKDIIREFGVDYDTSKSLSMVVSPLLSVLFFLFLFSKRSKGASSLEHIADKVHKVILS
ncbi:TPA: hypothetical protein N2777_001641 [Vibrio parahaemolyticus]|nr:hypothetical protein [Vibrio parahaemolyticus]